MPYDELTQSIASVNCEIKLKPLFLSPVHLNTEKPILS